MLDTLIPQEDADAAKELAKQFGRRGITLHLGKQCTKVEDSGSELTVHFGDGETVQADLMLVSVGRGPLVEGLGLESIGVEFDKRKGIAADEHRRTTVPHIYAVGDCAGYWQLAHTAFREGEVAAENAMGHDAVVDNRGVPRPIYTDPEIAGVGLTEAEAREQYGDDVAVGMFPWIANARAVMQNETVGWVKSIHETRYGELLGLVMVGPHVTDLIEAGRRRARRRIDGRDGRRRHGGAPDALGGDQGGGARRARSRDSFAAEAESRSKGLKRRISHGNREQAQRRPRLDGLAGRQARREAQGKGRAAGRGRRDEAPEQAGDHRRARRRGRRLDVLAEEELGRRVSTHGVTAGRFFRSLDRRARSL